MRNAAAVRWFFPLLFMAAAAGYSGVFSRFSEPRYETFAVTQVIDGDTIRAVDKSGRERLIRYEGIDCPETSREDAPGDPFSAEAARLNAKLVKNKTVKTFFGSQRYDTYGRLLGVVFSDGVNVNTELVRAGLATVLEVGNQDPELINKLKRAQESAMRNRRGIWSGNGSFKPPRRHERFLVPRGKMRTMAGKRVAARAKVTGMESKRKNPVVLKTDGGFDIVIFGKSIASFKHFGIDPRKHYKGKTVQVTGRARMYRGRANIIVRHPVSIYTAE